MMRYAEMDDVPSSIYRDLIPPNPDDTLIISFDPADFLRTITAAGVRWFNAFMNVEYSITNRNNVCGNGVKAMLGQAATRNSPTAMFILVLCPVILTQTDGQPKMFADLFGEDLQTNDRP